MKKLFYLLLLSLAVLVGAQDRYVKLDEKNLLTLTEKGKSCYRIESADNPTAKFAASELKKYLKLATGADADGRIVTIKVGILPESAGMKKLPRDGFIIRSVGNTIYIAGRDDKKYAPNSRNSPWGDLFERATLFAVYDFLERFAGARFVFPGAGEYIRKNPTLKIPAMDIFERPDNTVRNWTWEKSRQVKLNNYRLRMQTTLVPNNHGLGRMGYPERFGKSHPEYFALRANGTRSVVVGEHMGGQLCFSSPVVEEIYQDAKAYLTGKSAKERGVYVARWKTFVWDLNAAYGPYFNLMPQDGMTGCLCPQCRKLAAADPNWLSEQVWNLTVNISKRLKKEGVKGHVTQMAYGKPRTIPSCDIPADIPVQVAVDGPWSLDKKASWEKQDKVLTDWVRKLGHQVYLWNYVCKYSSRDIKDVPCSTPRAVAAYYSKVKDRSFGAFLESDTDWPSYQVFNKYVFAKMMWNKDLDGVRLYEDTCRDLFGKAAPAMLKFFDRLEKQWLERIANNVVMAPSGPVGVAPNERTLWEKIYSPAFRAELRKDINAAKNAVRTDRDALRRVVYFEREYLNRLDKAAGQFAAAQNARELCSAVVAGSLENAKKLKLRNPGKTPTVVRVWKDEDNLYVRGDCTEPEMGRVFTQKLPADDPSIWTLNCMEIFLDPGAAGKGYYQFMVSSDGQLCDLKVDKTRKITDVKWNSGAKLDAGANSDGWNFTLAIPLKVLGPVPPDRIGADFSRSRILKGEKPEYTRWSPFVRNNGDAENFGFLYLKEPPQKNLFRTPTFAAPKKGRTIGSWLVDNKNAQLMTLDKEEFMFDGQSMKLENPDKRNLNAEQYIRLEGGKRYRIRIFMRTALKSGSAFMQLWNGRNYAFPNGGAMGNTPWTAYSYEFTADKEIEKKHPYLRLYLYKGEGSAWFDGAVLEKIEP